MAETFGGVKREDLKDSEFVFPDERKFPIKTAADVSDAVSSWGRYKGSHTFEEFKRGVKRRAKAIGAESSLPKNWKEDMKQSYLDIGEALVHFGILGMRWGRRRGRSATPGHADSEAVKALRKKNVSELSDAELKKLNNRMQLERQFKELKAADVSPGRKLVTDILRDSGKELAKDFVKTTVKTALNPETWQKAAEAAA